MRTLLINTNRFKQPWPVVPHGLILVAGALEKAGHEVHVLDLCFSQRPARDIARAVAKWQPELVGLSIRNIDNSAGYNTEFFLDALRDEIIEPVKAVFQGPIVIGGPSVGINAAEMLAFFDLPLAIRGDGESAIVELARRLSTGEALGGMPGLVRRENGILLDDNQPWAVRDLDELSMSRPHHFIDLTPYRRFDSPLQVQTKRGCALACTYCTYNRIEGRAYRLRDPERVADEIETLHRETGIDAFELTDSTFNVPLNHAKAVLRAIADRGLKLRLRTMGLNPSAVDEELVALMEQTGFRDVDFGVEAASNPMLKSLGKNFKTSHVVRAAKLLQAHNIPVMWYLLLGAPGESAETLRDTFDTVNKAAAPSDLINIAVGLRVYNGSPIADDMRRDTPSCTADNFLHPVHVEPQALSLREVKLLTKRMALTRRNYFMYDEDETYSAFSIWLGANIFRLFAPQVPVWRIHIITRTLQSWTGIAWLRRMAFEIKHRRDFEIIEARAVTKAVEQPKVAAHAASNVVPLRRVSHADAPRNVGSMP